MVVCALTVQREQCEGGRLLSPSVIISYLLIMYSVFISFTL